MVINRLSVSMKSAAHSFMTAAMILETFYGKSKSKRLVNIMICKVLIMLHRNYKRPELKKLRKKLALNHAIILFFKEPSISSVFWSSSYSCQGSNSKLKDGVQIV